MSSTAPKARITGCGADAIQGFLWSCGATKATKTLLFSLGTESAPRRGSAGTVTRSAPLKRQWSN